MPGTVFVRGGFGSDYEGEAADSLRARIATADAEYDRQAARERHERDEQAAALREANVVASIRAAQERGELVDVRAAYRDGGVGRTPREAIEYASAMGDVEDMRSRSPGSGRRSVRGRRSSGRTRPPTCRHRLRLRSTNVS